MSTFSDFLHSLDSRARLHYVNLYVYVVKILNISMKEMIFKVAGPFQVFQCLFFKIALNLDVPENQKFSDEQKLMFRKTFMN